MLFTYSAIDKNGNKSQGSIETTNVDSAITSLQRRGFVIQDIKSGEKKSVFNIQFTIFSGVSTKVIVILSKQIATLFEAQVSVLRVFRLLAQESENRVLARILTEVTDDLQSGSSISNALARHPKVFSEFYVNMVKSGEETGKLTDIFNYLADYLDRSYEINSKARNALIYPAFIVFTFISVMILMLTMVIPKISAILLDSGQEIPIYTKVVIGLSDFLLNYGMYAAVFLIFGGYFLIKFIKTPTGAMALDQFKLEVPLVNNLYRKLYLSRISDNMNTMLTSGIPMVRALELTSNVVGSKVYKAIIDRATEQVKAGKSVSEAMAESGEMPSIMIQMIRVGEESGELGKILKTLSGFYRREVVNTVDTLVDLIEPIMIVLLALGVGFLLSAVLIPIYNISSNVT